MADSDSWLTTERLALRRFNAADLDWLAELHSDVDVTRHVGGVKDRALVEELLNVRILRYYDEYPGLGIWLTMDGSTGVVRARCGRLAGRARPARVLKTLTGGASAANLWQTGHRPMRRVRLLSVVAGCLAATAVALAGRAPAASPAQQTPSRPVPA